ncbi:MAG: DUF1499 domain-containing protein [Pseudomonadota bacterium]
MVAYLEEITSRAAIWCQRFATFLIPYFVIVILLYRFDKIETIQMFALIGVGLIISLISLVFAIRAVVELWTKGYRGGSKVVRGAFLSLLVLIPFIYFMFLALQFPLANDISTDSFDPPQYVSANQYRAQRIDEGMNPVVEYTSEYARRIVVAYPKLQPRRYPAGAERVLEAVTAIIQENEWPVTGTFGLPDRSADAATEDTESSDSEEVLEDNLAVPDDMYVEFVERTLVFGFENDVVVRIVSEDQNTLVDVRASSRWGRHDFGYNAKLIERFLVQLDTALLGIAGEG